MNAPNTRHIKRTMYKLNLDYGIRDIQWFHFEGSSAVDYESGTRNLDYSKFVIKRAISLPAKDIRRFAYSLSFLAVNTNFAYGAYFDVNDQILIIDLDTFPFRDYKIEEDGNSDFIIMLSRRYEIKHLEKFELNRVVMVTVREIKTGAKEHYVDLKQFANTGSESNGI